MIRKIINIDESKCSGCGSCAAACHEGAIAMVNGRAKLMRDDYCDGMGDCLPTCPTGAITFEEREAAAYDENAVNENKRRTGAAQNPDGASGERHDHGANGHACPGSSPRTIEHGEGGHACPGSSPKTIEHGESGHACPGSSPRTIEYGESGHACPSSSPRTIEHGASGHACPGSSPKTFEHGEDCHSGRTAQVSELRSWPVQIKLAPLKADCFNGAKLLVAADCTAYAYAAFHSDFMRGKVTLIGCPKLDAVDYSEKLTELIRQNDVRSVTVLRMEVPCCGGLEAAVKTALRQSGKFIPWQVVTITIDGRIADD